MIVKNESRIITRMFDSVISIIDAYLISDTGSTDNTKEVITEYFKSKGIPGEIIDVPFKNFGYNRTIALDAARAKSGCDYILLLDADMRLVVESNFDKTSLTAKAYHFRQKNASISWWNLRMIHTSVNAKCVCPTHEYYDIPGAEPVNLDTLWIDDIGDGGCKADKFDRDIRLLKEGLEESPENPRYLFYLANSYFNSNRHEESIPYYKRRVEVGGWYEEVWYSYYNLGFAYQRIGKMGDAIAMWLAGYEMYQARSENIHQIVKHYRIKGCHKLADIFCKLGLNIPYPRNDKLFVEDKVYDWCFEYERSIIGYYTKEPNLDIVSSHVMNKTFEHTDNILSNYKFYAKKLKNFAAKTINHTFSETVELNGDDNLMRSCNPCIFKLIQNGEVSYFMNIRMVNYEIYKDGAYSVQNKIATCNKLVQLDENFKKMKNSEVLFTPPNYNNYYVGLEDVKINQTSNGVLEFVGTTQACVNGGIILTIHRGIYDITGEASHLIAKPVVTPHNRGCEKNWALCGDRLVYEWYPLTIAKINGKDDASKDILNLEILEKYGTPPFFKILRGSTNGAEFDDEVWFLCHVVDHDKPRRYYHCFVVLNKEDLRLKRWSTLFVFDGESIEFCVGLIVEPTRVICSYSTWDRTAAILVLDRDVLDREIHFFNT